MKLRFKMDLCVYASIFVYLYLNICFKTKYNISTNVIIL